MTGLTALQVDAWNHPLITGMEDPPTRIENPRNGWAVALSINL